MASWLGGHLQGGSCRQGAPEGYGHCQRLRITLGPGGHQGAVRTKGWKTREQLWASG